MVVALMDSENYEWVALGETESEAANCILKEWNRRQKEFEKRGYKQAECFKTWHELSDWYGIRFYHLEKGQCEVL